MKIEYRSVKNQDIYTEQPICQCGEKMHYSEEMDKLICPNPNCIKQRVNSCLSTLRAIDSIAERNNVNTQLYELALEDYDLLTAYVDKCNIHYGGELITLGNSLVALGQLGSQLGTIIDTLSFELKDISKICGSELLEKFRIDFTALTDNQRQAVLEINQQLMIDGTIFLANLLYDEYIRYKQIAFELIDYLILIKYPTVKRSVIPVTLQIEDTSSLTEELRQLDNIGANLISNTDIQKIETEDTNADADNSEETSNLEELLTW